MREGFPYSTPNDFSVQLDLITHFWDRTGSDDFLVRQSNACRAANDCRLDVRTGARKNERADVYLAKEAKSPIVIFIHGGWWRGGSRKDFGFSVNGFAQRGYTAIMSDYTLCPDGTLPEITNATRAAVIWAYENADSINGDRDRIFVVGHSAGGQQAGMIAVTDWSLYGVPQNIVKGVVALSGMYDMRPFQYSWLQPWLQLTAEIARDESAALNVVTGVPPVMVMLGEEEAEEFHRQAGLFYTELQNKEVPSEYLSVPGEDHSTTLFMLAHPESLSCRAMAAFFDRCVANQVGRPSSTDAD